MRSISWHWWRRNGRRRLLLVLMAAAISACSLVRGPSPYRVTIPTLRAAPAEYEVGGIAYRCYRKDDIIAVIRELKTACLALGGTAAECQTE